MVKTLPKLIFFLILFSSSFSHAAEDEKSKHIQLKKKGGNKFQLVEENNFISNQNQHFEIGQKAARNEDEGVSNVLRIQLVGGTGADELVVYFDSLATAGYDTLYDAVKFLSDVPGVPNIYTYADSVKVSINAIGNFDQDYEVRIGLRVKVAGNYQINIVDISTFEPTVGLYLQDVQTGNVINLRTISQYNLNLPIGEFSQRFKFQLKPAVKIEVTNETCLQSDGSVKVTNNSSQTWSTSLLDYSGLVFGHSNLSNAEFKYLNDGNYILRLENNEGYTVDEQVSIEGAQVVEGNISPMSSNAFYTTDVIEASVSQAENGITYSWFLNDLLAGNGPEISLNITSPGLYTLKLHLSGENCEFETITTFSVTQESTVGIETSESASGFIIYPNPSREVLNVQINRKLGFTKLSVYDASGRMVHNEPVLNNQGQQAIQLQLNDYNSGIYQVILEGSNSRSSAKFTKL
jgi:hypothetical protein